MNNPQHTMREVAILVASLDQKLAGQLLARLTPDQAAQVRHAVAGVGEINQREAADLIRRFRRDHAEASEDRPAGVVLNGLLAAEHAASATPTPAGGGPGAAAPARPFRFLSDTDPQSLAPFLQRERPQTVAVVLSCLPPKQAARVLAVLPAPMQVEVVRRLASLDTTDEESLRVVAHELETWVRDQHRNGERRAAGLSAVAGIFAAAGPAEQQVLVKNLEALDHDLACKVAGADGQFAPRRLRETPPHHSSLKFDDLAQLDPRRLVTVLDAAEPELLVLALAGASGELASRILAQLPQPAADRLRSDLSQLGPIRLSDVEAAQTELAGLAQTLECQEGIKLTDGRPVMAA